MSLASIQQAVNAIQQHQAQQHQATLQQLTAQALLNGMNTPDLSGLDTGGSYVPVSDWSSITPSSKVGKLYFVDLTIFLGTHQGSSVSVIYRFNNRHRNRFRLKRLCDGVVFTRANLYIFCTVNDSNSL